MRLQRTIRIEADAARVWELLGERFVDVHAWSSAVEWSEPHPHGDRCEAGRHAFSALGETCEVIECFDRACRCFGVTVRAGLPLHVEAVRYAVWVRPAGEAAAVHVDATLELAWWAAPLVLPLRLQLSALLDGIGEELEHVARHGAVHPRKARQREAMGWAA